ncbi:Hypothetical protein NTJ_00168 [Nesidiocoris tenuis]|uniref:Uncharacterized protein n=1 Tax=Nesidiocoris tenuis TaxID=355587 RepID=A0ABN7A638_9HEMI|nr:Hypothetical protein NTJ_00168 [Nesidiocoris tenuis]
MIGISIREMHLVASVVVESSIGIRTVISEIFVNLEMAILDSDLPSIVEQQQVPVAVLPTVAEDSLPWRRAGMQEESVGRVDHEHTCVRSVPIGELVPM